MLLETDIDDSKLKGVVKLGVPVEIHWNDFDHVDTGYLFSLPECDSQDENDVFLHVPEPLNPGGIGDVPPVYQHLWQILSNENIKKVVIQTACLHNYTIWDRNVVKNDLTYRIYRCDKCPHEVAVKADQ